MSKGRAKIIPETTRFLPYQKKWILDDTQVKLMQKSRQIGMSWSTAYRLVREKSLEDSTLDTWVSSRDEIQARLFLDDCKSFAKILQMGAKDLGERVIDEEKKISAFTLRFANGKAINSMSSNPDAQAGKRGTRVLDEFALHPDPRKLYSIASPGITWGGQMEIISTHRGSGNYFNTLIKEILEGGNPKNISLHTVTLQNALDDGFLRKLQDKLPAKDPRQDMDEADYFNYVRNSCADEETFLQEYMCIPSNDASAFIDYNILDQCHYGWGEDWELPKHSLTGSLYLGIDIGRKKDLTVMWLMEKLGDVLYTRRVITLKKMPFSAQEDILHELMELGISRVCIDETGLGMQFAERAQDNYGKYVVEGITFTPNTKSELAYPLRGAFEDKKIRIPRDKDIEADIRGIRKEVTSAGNIRFSGERSDRGHCDRFWAMALALHAAKDSDGGYFTPKAFRRDTEKIHRRSITMHKRLGSL
ncbi:MAG: terminase family protein [Opitutales bacterium]|nr:terminase family protein [Opitutales bacterium]